MTDDTRAQALAKLQRLGQEYDAAGKWTPGEWTVFGEPEDVPGIDATLPDGKVFSIVVYAELGEDGDCGIHGRDADEAWANARLIAAAPAMAEALAGIEQTAREYVRNWPNSPTVRAPWEAVLAALAKARGEQE